MCYCDPSNPFTGKSCGKEKCKPWECQEAMRELTAERDALKAELKATESRLHEVAVGCANAEFELEAAKENHRIHAARLISEKILVSEHLEAARKQEPCGWQCRFITPTETWGYCSKEHYETVKAAPHEYPGYEVREVYASPIPAKISKGVAQVLIHAAISENPELLELFCSQAPAQQNTDTAQFSRDPYDLADELYLRGYSDCRLERDYDPRGCEEWQAVVDAIGSEVKR